MNPNIETAMRSEHHKELVQLARKSHYIVSFSSIMFSSPDSYGKGWIRIVKSKSGKIAGFTCVRHKIRQPETMLYFIMVDPDLESCGIGQLLMKDLEEQTPHDRIALKVMKDNNRAIAFYEHLGYVVEDLTVYGGKGILMAKKISH